MPYKKTPNWKVKKMDITVSKENEDVFSKSMLLTCLQIRVINFN